MNGDDHGQGYTRMMSSGVIHAGSSLSSRITTIDYGDARPTDRWSNYFNITFICVMVPWQV